MTGGMTGDEVMLVLCPQFVSSVKVKYCSRHRCAAVRAGCNEDSNSAQVLFEARRSRAASDLLSALKVGVRQGLVIWWAERDANAHSFRTGGCIQVAFD